MYSIFAKNNFHTSWHVKKKESIYVKKPLKSYAYCRKKMSKNKILAIAKKLVGSKLSMAQLKSHKFVVVA